MGFNPSDNLTAMLRDELVEESSVLRQCEKSLPPAEAAAVAADFARYREFRGREVTAVRGQRAMQSTPECDQIHDRVCMFAKHEFASLVAANRREIKLRLDRGKRLMARLNRLSDEYRLIAIERDRRAAWTDRRFRNHFRESADSHRKFLLSGIKPLLRDYEQTLHRMHGMTMGLRLHMAFFRYRTAVLRWTYRVLLYFVVATLVVGSVTSTAENWMLASVPDSFRVPAGLLFAFVVWLLHDKILSPKIDAKLFRLRRRDLYRSILHAYVTVTAARFAHALTHHSSVLDGLEYSINHSFTDVPQIAERLGMQFSLSD